MIDRAGIAALIPHAGAMCLLDDVLAWNATGIVCRATVGPAAAHPMAQAHPKAQGGDVGAICGVEYAAQAMAVHGALTAARGQAPGRGYLASLRDVACHAMTLPSGRALIIAATCLHGEVPHLIYHFTVSSEGATILSGRAAVVLTGFMTGALTGHPDGGQR